MNSLLTILYLDANHAGRRRRSEALRVPRQRTSRPSA
jgi:hypothetical protein